MIRGCILVKSVKNLCWWLTLRAKAKLKLRGLFRRNLSLCTVSILVRRSSFAKSMVIFILTLSVIYILSRSWVSVWGFISDWFYIATLYTLRISKEALRLFNCNVFIFYTHFKQFVLWTLNFLHITGHALLNTDQHRKLKLGTKMMVNNL